ncbi:tRNA pseudouridine(38-40) synthase TruA [Pleionea sp. CnH1-48]|uniref:tRNA pseudouridine(38-40) synthase TruA n=1 Tax=Pleionea sp. CnH1-48 TaxID=2954494 RepID=UPI0020984959|nr:tRNA pseudouridine(38-40) synthase TruA [Pleionea sp. CnH1-48]MCO7226080.1 tRNA pseudouridine(38-40) synthase TruA [Pleionea sp. CnH1-48]
MIIAVGVEYLGSNYCGWQRQTHSPSVQACVEKALSTVANHKVEVFCAGRTDTGVHATGQVIHFETSAERPSKAWVMGGNAHLPDDIAIQWAQTMKEDFHARFSAVSRRYRYVIANVRSRPAVLSGQVTWIREPLDETKMHEAAQHFLGEQNFSSFQAASCQSPTPFRNVTSIKVIRKNEFVMIDITANAFLHHMVRNISGSLIEVGRRNQATDWIKWLMQQEDRTLAAPTAAPDGLYFIQANYPAACRLPGRQSSLWLFD